MVELTIRLVHNNWLSLFSNCLIRNFIISNIYLAINTLDELFVTNNLNIFFSRKTSPGDKSCERLLSFRKRVQKASSSTGHRAHILIVREIYTWNTFIIYVIQNSETMQRNLSLLLIYLNAAANSQLCNSGNIRTTYICTILHYFPRWWWTLWGLRGLWIWWLFRRYSYRY